MTKEEAIKFLKVELRLWESDCKSKHAVKDALKMAIKVLEQEPCEDAISCKAVIEWLKAKDIIKLSSQEDTAWKELKALSSVTPQEPTTKNDLAVDWDELKRKILMEVDGGTDDKWLRYVDVCDNISNSIDDFKADLLLVTPQEPRWIPVKERLPEKSGECLVTIKANPNNVCHLLNYRKPENYWTGKDIGKKSLASDDVLAWMPLPKPYKAESESKE